jgi:plastocyanin
MATVIINSDLSANPPTVTIKGGETVTWVGDGEFAIHLPAPYTNPNITPGGGKFSGTSGAFPSQSQRYVVHYTVTAHGQVHDPDVEVLPSP